MTTLDARLETLNGRIEALRVSRQHLKAQRARKRERHESTASDDAKMQSMTLAQLRTELAAERRRYRLVGRVTGPGAKQKVAACRSNAKRLAEHIKKEKA